MLFEQEYLGLDGCLISEDKITVDKKQLRDGDILVGSMYKELLLYVASEKAFKLISMGKTGKGNYLSCPLQIWSRSYAFYIYTTPYIQDPTRF